MNKITKILLVLLASVSLSFNAMAGELNVTGSAKASYVIGGNDDGGKGLGISNEIGLGATGELDNGMAWNYKIMLDPNAGGTIDNDDQTLTLASEMGTAGIFISTGGLSQELAYGIGANGTGSDFAAPMTVTGFGYDVSSYSNLQYHTPADLLPYGIQAKVGFVPNMASSADSADFKTKGVINNKLMGHTATMYNLSAKPIDGLNVSGAYFETSGAGYTSAPTSGELAANYTYGPVKVGYATSYKDVGLSTRAAAVTNYANEAMGIQFAVNDAISVSWSSEKAEQRTTAAIVAAATGVVKTTVESEITSIQVAYNIGGATVGLTQVEVDDSDYTLLNDEKMTLLTLAMAF
jgi:hypothetical protein